MIEWTHIEVGQLWLMLECIGLIAVYNAVVNYDYTYVVDECDKNQLKGWINSHGRQPMLDTISDYAGWS
jgi:hypothetical protein